MIEDLLFQVQLESPEVGLASDGTGPQDLKIMRVFFYSPFLNFDCLFCILASFFPVANSLSPWSGKYNL